MTKLPAAAKGGLVRAAPDYVLTLDDLGVTIRPKRSRNPAASVTVPWDAIYRRALMARVTDHKPKTTRRKSVRRGLLSVRG